MILLSLVVDLCLVDCTNMYARLVADDPDRYTGVKDSEERVADAYAERLRYRCRSVVLESEIILQYACGAIVT